MSIWDWPQIRGDIDPKNQITLGEGKTPLVRSRHIGPRAGLKNLYFKLETVNPTGSYKDRFAAAAVAGMLQNGQRRCLATSSGNTGSALAAYCASAALDCEIAVVETAPPEKLKQMAAYGAKIFKVRGFGTYAEITRQVMNWVMDQGKHPDISVQISAFHYSPLSMRGVQSISYELVTDLPNGVDHVFVPAGGGGLTLAIARGFASMAEHPHSLPKIHCVQPEGNDTIATPLRAGMASARAVQCATRISGLQVASVLDGDEVIQACGASGGTGFTVSDEAVWEMQGRLAREEGLFVEPAAAVPVVAALKAFAEGKIAAIQSVCCILTGSGFKDSPSVDKMIDSNPCQSLSISDLFAASPR